MAIEPLAIGVCSWSLQVTSVPELKRFLDRLGIDVVQIACGDPHHASWSEGDGMRHNVMEHCDVLARLPISPRMESLNISNAAAIALYAVATAGQ